MLLQLPAELLRDAILVDPLAVLLLGASTRVLSAVSSEAAKRQLVNRRVHTFTVLLPATGAPVRHPDLRQTQGKVHPL